MPEYKRRYTFFESFYRATKYMSPEQKLMWYEALNEFAFNGAEPCFEDPLLMSNWEQVCTTLTRSIRSAEAGRKGGSAKASKGGSKEASDPSKGASKHKESNVKESKVKEEERNAKLLKFYNQTAEV